MLTRRNFFFATAAATANAAAARLTSRERVDRALRGQDVDRRPFTYWHHFLDATEPAAKHAQSTLEFHRRFHTDLVKVMSDYPYPKPLGEWYEAKVEKNPFPRQIEALGLIAKELGRSAHFVETVFNPWKVAENLSSPEAVRHLMTDQPQDLLAALEAIANSEANHARLAVAAGASGIFLAIANAGDGVMTREEYARFSEPFDKMVLEAVSGAPLNTLHLHGSDLYLDRFYSGWPASAINYSTVTTKIGIAEFRKHYSGVLLAGIDERNYAKLTEDELRKQWRSAEQAAGKRFILAPGCSVPDNTGDAEMLRLPRVLGVLR